jgi:pimeloyl-ACP methyl ester carboxylesterase
MPVFLLHGTPGSRNGPRPRASVLYRLGIQLVCYDRPGYGGSERQYGRPVKDAADDVRAIADKLGIDSFGVVGRSGGGPHALACAALLPDRVQSAAVLVSLAPPDAAGLDWYGGMAASNVAEYTRAAKNPEAFEATLDRHAAKIRDNPESMFGALASDLSGPDSRVVDDIAMRALLTDTYAEALKNGAAGWIDDVLALCQPWGFDLSKISAPVYLWHGADDRFSPVAHTYWLSDRITDSHTEIEEGAAHFGAVEILPRVLAWIKEARGSERRRIQGAHQPALST